LGGPAPGSVRLIRITRSRSSNVHPAARRIKAACMPAGSRFRARGGRGASWSQSVSLQKGARKLLFRVLEHRHLSDQFSHCKTGCFCNGVKQFISHYRNSLAVLSSYSSAKLRLHGSQAPLLSQAPGCGTGDRHVLPGLPRRGGRHGGSQGHDQGATPATRQEGV